MQFDTIIKAKNILTPAGIREGIILIKDGVIADILPYVDSSADGIVEDAGDHLVMPGVIDPHVHLNEPGREDWEGFDTGTRAAAAGGITTVIDMPLNSTPCTTSAKNLALKIKAAQNQLHVNCGFWGGVVPGNEKQQDALLTDGAFGLKAFLTHSGIDDFPKSGLRELLHAMDVLKKYNKPLLAHCELDDNFSSSQLKENPQSYQAYLQSRPDEWELKAISMLIDLCREKKARTHVVHLSSAKALSIIEDAKSEELPLTVETAQHYIYFTAEEIRDGHTEYKCAPPIRSAANRELLLEGLRTGTIDFLATDHSPAPPALKETTSGNFEKAWGGIAGLQFALPVAWTAAKEHGFTTRHLMRWLCERPAAFLNLNNKGSIQKGFDADIVIWNPEEKFTVKGNSILHKHKLTPYIGCNLFGVVKQTYVNGTKVYDNGNVVELNKGKILLST
ncbi:MAG: allantoinase AllB [Bacteroidota bacterium]